jgi:uncharacterized membrane protein YidH (DUF202 family)
MHLFGDPTFPKKNIVGGSLIMAVAGFEFGTFVQRAIQSRGDRVGYVMLLLVLALFFIGIKTFRLGLAFVPWDPGDQQTNRGQRTTVDWIVLLVFWIVIIVAPVAIIQFFGRR